MTRYALRSPITLGQCCSGLGVLRPPRELYGPKFGFGGVRFCAAFQRCTQFGAHLRRFWYAFACRTHSGSRFSARPQSYPGRTHFGSRHRGMVPETFTLYVVTQWVSDKTLQQLMLSFFNFFSGWARQNPHSEGVCSVAAQGLLQSRTRSPASQVLSPTSRNCASSAASDVEVPIKDIENQIDESFSLCHEGKVKL